MAITPAELERLASDERVTVRWRGEPDADGEAVVYWMQRAQRACDNPALDTAITLGNLLRKPVIVFFGLNPFIVRANRRHYQFLVEGLPDIASGLASRRVGFVLRRYPDHRIAPFLQQIRPCIVVGDENPLRQTERWRQQFADDVRVPFWTVDTDVVVPSGLLTTEQYAARTIRPRIQRVLDAYLVPSTEPVAARAWQPTTVGRGMSPNGILDGLPITDDTTPSSAFVGGTAQARLRLQRFVNGTLDKYDEARNHPELHGTSQLSPYLHFGHIGPREVALAVRDSGRDNASVAAFLEQMIVRRELAVNFVRFNPNYDRLEGCERWAVATLRKHAEDERPHLYSLEEFDAAATHDPLWNAAQRQMIMTGWMSGYIRMYWAKKILEWSDTPARAFDIAVALNDRYELDGRDPNGYANIAWAVGGKHDRPWPPRPIYGTVRSMSFASTRRKFDAARYVEQFNPDERLP